MAKTSRLEIQARNGSTCSEACVRQTSFESSILVPARSVSIQKLIVQAFLSPGCERAVNERGVEEKVDAVVQMVHGKRGRSKF